MGYMAPNRLDRPLTALFGILLALQIVKWGSLKLPVQGPLAVLLATGLFIGLAGKAWPWRNRALFFVSYGSCFLLVWAVGHPSVGLEPGRLWALTFLATAVMAGSIVFNSQNRAKWAWVLAIGCSVMFGLLIAFISGPRGGSDWMLQLAMKWLDTDDWRLAQVYVHNFRKTLHFTGYGLAALCSAIAARHGGAKVKSAFLIGLAWPVPLAVFDEIQQTGAQNRTGRASDVLLDIAGMLLFLSLWAWRTTVKERRAENL